MTTQRNVVRGWLALLAGFLLAGCSFPNSAGLRNTPAATVLSQPDATQASAPAAATLPVLTPSVTPDPAAEAAAYFSIHPPADAASYHLPAWTPETADDLLEEMNAVYERLWTERVTAPEDTQRAASVLLFVLRQALFFFPDAPQAESWRWQQALVQARSGSASAAAQFADLIEAGVKSGVQPADLAAWMVQMEPRLVEAQVALAEVEGPASGSLLTLSLAGNPASYWIVDGQVYLFSTGWEFQGAPGQAMRLEWHDLDGDAQPEAWLVRVDSSRRVDMASLVVYALARDDAGMPVLRRLDFEPALPAVRDGAWQITEEAGGSLSLHVRLRLDGGDALCEYQPEVVYARQGPSFQWVSFEPLSLEKITASGLSEPQARLCLDLAVDWLRRQAHAGEPLAQQAVQELLDGFPYGSDAVLYQGLYPPDEADRARFELALSLAWSGDVKGAAHWMSAVAETPIVPEDPWAAPARAFVEAYEEAGDLRSACLASQACYGRSHFSLYQLAGLMTPADQENPAGFFKLAGVPILQDGTQDLDGDGAPETWWVEDSAQTADVLWLAAQQQDGLVFSSLEINAPSQPPTFSVLEPLPSDRVWQLASGAEPLRFTYRRLAGGQIVLRSLPQQRRSLLSELLQSLYAGAMPGEVLQAAAALQATPYFDCAVSTELCQPEESLALLLALAHEQNGDLEAAAEYYLQLWQGFPPSPAAWLAQMRLQD